MAPISLPLRIHRERETAAQKYVSIYKSLHMHGRVLAGAASNTGVFPVNEF